jgi:hypothetical protein
VNVTSTPTPEYRVVDGEGDVWDPDEQTRESLDELLMYLARREQRYGPFRVESRLVTEWQEIQRELAS